MAGELEITDGRASSYVHRGGSRPLIGATIDRAFRDVCLRFPEREALVSIAQSRRLTYAELDREVDSLARGLLALGLEPGTRVGIWSTDNVEWVLLQLATARVGAVLVNINPAYRKSELAHSLVRASVETLFVIPRFKTSDYVGMLTELCPELREHSESHTFATFPVLRNVVVWDPSSPAHTSRPAPGFLTWQELLAKAEGIAPEQVHTRAAQLDPDDPINIQFTSGTTGQPKAVVLTHHGLVNNARFIADAMRFSEHDRLCVPIPFYHCFGMVVSTLACLTRGATLVVPGPHFEPGDTLRAIADERCTAVHGVPTMFIAELAHPQFADFDLSSLRTGIMAGAPCPPELLKRVIDEMGCAEILVGYGQTEASPVTHLTHADDDFTRRVETVGVNMPHTEAKIIDTATGAVLPCGGQGEVCVRGYHVMRGYFEQPEATSRTIDEAGWLHTGDLGTIDEDGYLRITGRIKDMIIRGGENIYPAEIEAFYYEHPKIETVAVVGVPDERLGEEVVAWICLHEGATATPDELRDYAKGKIAHYKIPKHIEIVDELPMTVTGKIQKFKIRELAAKRLASV